MSHVLRSSFFRMIVLLVACATFSVAAFAQSTVTGAIAGTVTDPSKAVVAGAKVTIRNPEINFQATSDTDVQGKFRVVLLQPGTYEVTAQAPNFATMKAERVIVEVGRITELELTMNVAGKEVTVEVTGEAPMVNTLQQDFTTNLNTDSISNLPINGRRWSQYALLTPGATPDGNFGLISFRGISGLLNNNTVDGGDNNQAFFSEERGRTRAAYVISQSSVREFQVNTSNYSAEYGRAAGAVVNSVTKSGTNKIHGEGFWYIRDNALGATNPFTVETVQNPDGSFTTLPFKPEDRRQQFGGNLGGPIVKDRLFFFFNYDGQRRNFPGVGAPGSPTDFWQTITVANPALRNQTNVDCPHFLANTLPKGVTLTDGEILACRQITQDQVNRIMGQLAAMTGETPRRGDQDIFFPKLDWRIGDKHTFSASYNRMRWNSPAGIQTQPNVKYTIDNFGNDYVKSDIAIGRLSSSLTSMVANELRFTWGRDFEFETSQTPVGLDANWLTAYGNRPPALYISSGGGLNFGRVAYLERYAYPDESRAQWSDTLSWAAGKHFLKFGVDLSRNDDLTNNLYNGGGNYSWSSRAAFITDVLQTKGCMYYPKTGTPYSVECYSRFQQAFGPFAFEFKNWDYAFFVQDDFRVLPRLTLSFGLRYEYEKLPSPQQPNPALPLTLVMPHDKNNVGPRFGFAFDMFGDGKTSLRGGYGIYYGRIINAAIFNAISQTGMVTSQTSYSINNYASGAPIFPNVLSQQPTGAQSALQFARNLQNPQIHQMDLVLEHEVAKNTVVSVSYLLSLGRELPQYIDTNIQPATQFATINMQGGPFDGQSYTLPIYTQRINTAFGPIVTVFSNVNSNYNALVAQFNRRMTDGLQFQSSYTWSHALDFGQGSVTTGTSSQVFDPYNLRGEYGTSNFDIRQRIVGSVVWQPQGLAHSSGLTKAVLGGWSIAPVLTFSSGVPYTEYLSGYVNGTLPSGFNGAGGGSRLPFISRNSWRYPWIQNVDLRLSRQFKVAERHSVEFLAEAFNLFNHEQITGINNQMYILPSNSVVNGVVSPSMKYDTSFGTYSQAGATLYRERNVQFGIKYAF